MAVVVVVAEVVVIVLVVVAVVIIIVVVALITVGASFISQSLRGLRRALRARNHTDRPELEFWESRISEDVVMDRRRRFVKFEKLP